MPPDSRPIPLDTPVDATRDGETVAAALAEVKRLQEETRAKAAELDRALDRLRDLTEAGIEHPAREHRPRVAPTPRDLPNDAVLRATEMAVAGRQRAEIEDALREQFGLEDPGPVLDRILGAD